MTTSPRGPVFKHTKIFQVESLDLKPLESDHLSKATATTFRDRNLKFRVGDLTPKKEFCRGSGREKPILQDEKVSPYPPPPPSLLRITFSLVRP